MPFTDSPNYQLLLATSSNVSLLGLYISPKPSSQLLHHFPVRNFKA